MFVSLFVFIFFFFFFNDPATTEIYTLSLHDALPIWPCVELQWEWLGGLTPLQKAAVVGAGDIGTALAIPLARAGLEVQLGCRTARQAEQIAASRRAVTRDGSSFELPDAVTPCTVADIEFAGVDLVVFAVPLRVLPAVLSKVGPSIGE